MLFLGLHRNHFILSDDLLAEYRAVLLRPAVVARHGLTVAEVDTVLEGIVVNAGRREAGAALRPALTPAELAVHMIEVLSYRENESIAQTENTDRT